ncbi:MAG TPA: hypothetical protein ENN79_08735 [Desulfobacteraceae bacterium]|nr:hypothetical protein [Desulfobacteraceae bacterium]
MKKRRWPRLCSSFMGLEIKSKEAVVKKDTRVLKELGSILGDQWLGGIVVYRGNEIGRIEEPNLWAVPSRRLFQP